MSGFVFSEEPFDGTSVYCVPNTAKTCSPVISSHSVLPQCSERGTISPFTDEAPGLESWRHARGYTAREGAGPGPPGSAQVQNRARGRQPPPPPVRVHRENLEGASPRAIPSRSSE